MWPLLLIDWEAISGALIAFGVGVLAAQHAPPPEPQQHSNGRQIVIPADADNSCHAELTAGPSGHVFRVLLDSGATGANALVFGSNMTADLGINPRSLSYPDSYTSANGVGRQATVRLPEVKMFGWVLHDVPAVITKAAQDEPLFGAGFLHQLSFTTVNGYCLLSMPMEARYSGPARVSVD
jgi:clan AA aspartic protease (TIGR02281 family)